MSSVRLLLSATLLPVSAAALAQAGATPERVAAIADCKGRWFEAAAIVDPATKRGTRIRLCSKPGATDAEWIKTLRDAADQLKKREMPAEPKATLLAQIDVAIANVGQPAATAGSTGSAPAVVSAPAPAAASAMPGWDRVAAAPPRSAVRPAAPAAPTNAKAPAIAVTCTERGQAGEGPCGPIGRDTVLVIKASGNMDQGARLSLLRRGEDRGEIKLAPLRPGQVVRAGLPAKLCAGVNSSKVEFQLLGPTGTAGQRFGPYTLNCR